MCGIGAIYFKSRVDLDILERAISQTELRGRDAFGIYHFKNGKLVDAFKVIGSFSDHTNSEGWKEFKSKVGIGSLLIWNNRAHPLPEELKVVQPIEYDGVVVAHNGTINNDKLLLEQEFNNEVEIEPWVDTHILPLLYRKYNDWKIALSKIEGGVAAIAYDTKKPNELVLIKNFKPLSWAQKDGILLVVSEVETIPYILGDQNNVYENYIVEWVKPYTLITINLETGEIKREEFQSKHAAHRHALPLPSEDIAVVMCSGGLDSSTAAFVACKVHKRKKVYLVNFNYGQRSADREWEAVRKLADQLRSEGYNVEAVRMDARWLGRLGKSPLTDRTIELPKEVDSVESTKCWVPARNLVFLSYLAAFCEAVGAKYIYTGINLEESGSYPDNDIEAYRMANLLLDYYTLGRVKLVMVLERLMKYEIVTLGYHLGLDYSYTWSCDEGYEKPCGVCGCCWTRQHALRKAGIPDKQEYLNKPSRPAPWLGKETVKKPDINKILRAVMEVH